MPELPEVETMRRGVAGIIGQTIAGVTYPPCALRPMSIRPNRPALKRRLMDRKIAGTQRRGKRMILRFDNKDALVIEPRMTGLVLVSEPPNHEHLRLILDLEGPGECQLMFWDRRGLGVISLMAETEFEQALGPEKLGPDALEIAGKSLKSRLGKSRREVKVALLDQAVVAGIGNLYAAEILFESAIDPRARCDRLTKNQWERIAEHTRAVLEKAIRYEGSTLSDGTYRNALNQSGQYQNEHRVYDRAGEICGRCRKGRIRRIVQAQRATFYCPGCQRKS